MCGENSRQIRTTNDKIRVRILGNIGKGRKAADQTFKSMITASSLVLVAPSAVAAHP
jgi:hypothetical protein